MSTISRSDLLGGTAAFALLAGPWASPGLAAETASAAGATAPIALETVVVTATKRKENIQEVPVSISEFGEKDLADRGVQQARDLNAPNFLFPQMYTTSRSYISVRGIFQEVNTIGFEGGFSAYVDGVYLGRNMSYDIDMLEVERVEILRGPQGTLFGKNTIGGLMNVVTRQPKFEFEGNVQAEIGNMDLRRMRGGVNIPLIDDKLAARLSVQTVQRDGYVQNLTVGGEKGGSIDQLSGRAQFLFTPNENFDMNVSLDYLDSDSIGYTFEIVGSKSTEPSFGDEIPYTYHPDAVPKEFKRDKGASLTANYDFTDVGTLTFVFGARKTQTQWILDGDAASLDLYVEDIRDQQDLRSYELRFASATGDRLLDYVVGAYYYDEKADYSEPIPFSASYPGGPFLVYYNDRVHTTDNAAFAHLDLHATSALTLYGGVRYTDETKKLEGERRVLPITYPIPPELIPGLTTDGTGRPPQFTNNVGDTVTTWEAGARYQFTDTVMGYAEASTGFKSAGFNLRNGLSVDPEHLTAYEIGVKSVFLDNKLILNAAAFFNDYKDLQVRSLDTTTVPITTVLHNAASVEAKGFEVELEALPMPNLTLHLGIGYVDSKYKDFKNVPSFGSIIDATGNELPMTPPWTINGGARYDQMLPNEGKIVWNLDFNFVDERWSILDGGQNHPAFALPSYTALNGRIGYQAPDSRWEVFLWGKNLTDEDALVDSRLAPLLGPSTTYPNGLTFQYATHLQPRTYGVNMSVNF